MKSTMLTGLLTGLVVSCLTTATSCQPGHARNNSLVSRIPIDGSLRGLASTRVDFPLRVAKEPEAIDPKAEEFYNQGEQKYGKKDYQGAIADFDRAIELNPNHWAAYIGRGNARDDSGDSRGAIADYDRALKIDPNNASAYYNRGVTQSRLGDNQAALSDFNQALKINPNYASAYNNRGIIRNSLGDKDGALADFEQAIKLNPNLPQAYGNRGNVRERLGDKQGAIADIQKAAELFQQQGDKYNYVKARMKVRELEETPSIPQ
jgi:tetratricopeptide (TPR) repeat protein